MFNDIDNEFVFDLRQGVHMKGGGGSSGTVDYPEHMKVFHSSALNHSGTDITTSSLVDLMNVAFANNPYASLVYYNASGELVELDAQVAAVKAAKLSLTDGTWSTAIDAAKIKVDSSILDEDTIAAEVQAFITLLDNDLATKTYPAFETGMRDINAVMSSAFVTGKAIITEGRNAQIAKYDADLRHKVYLLRADLIAKEAESLLDWYNSVFTATKETAAFDIDVQKMKVIIGREGVDQDMAIRNKEGTWEFEAYVYAGNFLASIGGGTMMPAQMSKAQSALSGAFSGAAAGSLINGKSGAGYGAVIGGIAGMLQ